jgi:ligand-binding sensor domain-containing protein
MKRSSGIFRMFPALVGVLWVCVSVVGGFAWQVQETPPTASPTPSPSPTVTPVRTPSPTPLPGAQNFHRWGSITVFNGLPSDSVRAIAQTPDGVMWFGTDNGLARFDGRRVQTYTLGDDDANRVLVMKTDATGRIWIGTQKGAFVFSQSRADPISGTENVGVQSLLIADGNFLGTDTGLVLRVVEANGAREAQAVVTEPLKDGNAKPLPITGLTKDQGRLLVATYGRGVFTFRDGKFSEFASSPRPTFVNSIAADASGKLWLGTDAKRGVSGIFRLDDPNAARIAAPTSDVWPLSVDDTGVWAGTARYGLFHVKDGKTDETFTFENTSGGLRSNTVYSIFTDREGVVWFGTNRGVSRYDPFGPFQETVSDSPNSNFVRTLFQNGEGETIYAGTNRGLFKSVGKNWQQVPGVGDRPVYAIYRTSDEPRSLIVATPQGTFDPSGKLIVEGDSRAVAELNGRIYAAVFGRGIFDITDRSRPKLVFANDSVTSLAANSEKMWIGTGGNGLFSFDGANAKLEISPDQLKSGTIWKVWQAGSNSPVWIAGQHGVFVIRDGAVEQISSTEDVRDLWVSSDQNDDVWAATTMQGLIHMRRDERFGWLGASIGFEQGLPSEKAFSILHSKETLLVATNRGVVDLRSSGFVKPELIPIRILSQRLHDLSEIGSTIALDYPQNSILVEVAGQSSRTFPEEFQYSFLLKNAKGEVVDQRFSNNSQYDPTELKPGDYTIESVAFDRDLNASEPLLIKFSIAKAPFPWTATALGVLLAIATIGLVWAMFEHRRIRQRNRELAAARFDLANEAERERSRIARDLHDQTLADLRMLMMKSDKGELSQPDLRQEIESVSTEIRRICEDLSPSVLENVGLVPALEFLLSQLHGNHEFRSDDDLEERIDFPVNVQLQIYRIAQEVLANIRSNDQRQRHRISTRSSDGKRPRHREHSLACKPCRRPRCLEGADRRRKCLYASNIARQGRPGRRSEQLAPSASRIRMPRAAKSLFPASELR